MATEAAGSPELTEGIILLDKPPGITSFQSLGFLKRCLGTRRVGHAGTLDKFAEGLLIVMTGRMTRLCAVATAFDKEYLATFTFGLGTDTLDPEGEVTGARRPSPARAELEAVLPEFRGALSQVPPAYSAIHVDGRRASAAARAGETVQLAGPRGRHSPPGHPGFPSARGRPFASPVPRAPTCVPSRATLPRRSGTCAHVSRLRRTRIGGFSVERRQDAGSVRRRRGTSSPRPLSSTRRRPSDGSR